MNEVYGRAQGNGWVAHEGVGTPWPVAWWDWVEFQLYYREAKLLIDGTVPSDDPRLHVLRACALAAMLRGPAADVEFAAALMLRPDDTQVRLSRPTAARPDPPSHAATWGALPLNSPKPANWPQTTRNCCTFRDGAPGSGRYRRLP